MARTKHKIFEALGTVRMREGKRHWIPKSPAYVSYEVSQIPEGKEVSATFSEWKGTRSRAQLNMYMAILGILARHIGLTKDECHDAVVRLKFGTRRVLLGTHEVEVRRSVSDAAKMNTNDMSELIEYVKELCTEMDVRIPTASELGYITSSKSKIV